MPNTWRDIAARKQKERVGRIPSPWLLPFSYSAESGYENVLDVPRECGLLSTQELSITEDHDATALVAKLASGRLNSVDVVTAFCKRAAIAQQLTNCLTEIFFDEGIARAKQLDEILRNTGKPVGPLHGLPVSLKDTFKVKGYDASIGYANLCFQPAKTNSTLVDLLLEQGAVLYCKTNIPQTLAALDSHNNVFGRTLNPANRKVTAGGSSGGEGALVALRGSPLGIGTDVGGSIRVPAMCNGLYGVKPSHGRVPYAGQQPANPEGSSRIALEATAGPIATSVRDCQLLMKAIGDSAPWTRDPDVVSQSWSEQSSLALESTPGASKTLRLGIMRTDGHVTPLPPIQNLLEEVAKELRQPRLPSWEKIEIVEIDLSRFGPEILKCFNGLMSLDGANYVFDMIESTNEPLSPWLQSRFKRRAPKSLDETRKIQAKRVQLQTEFLNVWSEKGGYWITPDSKAKKGDRTLDAIICPVAPHPIPPIDGWNTANYTGMFNLMDVSAGVIPVRPIRESDLQGEIPRDSHPLNGWDATNQKLWTDVDRKVYLGTELSIQVVSQRLQEKQLMETMVILTKALSGLRSEQQQRTSSKL